MSVLSLSTCNLLAIQKKQVDLKLIGCFLSFGLSLWLTELRQFQGDRNHWTRDLNNAQNSTGGCKTAASGYARNQVTSVLWKAQQILTKGPWCLLPSSERTDQHHNPSICWVAKRVIRNIKVCTSKGIFNAACAAHLKNLLTAGIILMPLQLQSLAKYFNIWLIGETLIYCDILL